jgi:hypothetical protein
LVEVRDIGLSILKTTELKMMVFHVRKARLGIRAQMVKLIDSAVSNRF